MQMRGRPARRTVLGAAALIALLVAMLLSSEFVTPEELAAAGPQEFDPEQAAQELFDRARTELPEQASPLADVVTALQQDTQEAATRFDAVNPTETAFVFAVTATGRVVESTDTALRLEVEGIPGDTSVLVPVTTAINGTVVRDALGFRFADAPGQSAFQFVGDELKTLMQAEIRPTVEDPTSLEGEQVTVVGAISVVDNGGPQPAAKPVNVQPISIEAGS